MHDQSQLEKATGVELEEREQVVQNGKARH